MPVTAAQAVAILAANPNAPPQIIVDTATNLIANMTALQALGANNQLASVTLTGTNTVNNWRASQMAGLPRFSLAPGATLMVADSAYQLLNADYAAGLTIATGMQVTGIINKIKYLSATQVAQLASRGNLSVAADTTILVVNGANTVNAAQASSLAAFSTWTLDAGATVTVRDTRANLLNSAGALASLSAASKMGTATYSDSTAKLVVTTYANYLTMTMPTDSYDLVITGAPVSAAAVMQNNSHVAAFTVADTAANLQSGLPGLVADSKLTATSTTDAAGSVPTFTLTWSAYAADDAVLAKLTTAYNLVLSGASAAQAASLAGFKSWNQAASAKVAVSDTRANIFNNLAALESLGAASRLTSVTYSDSATKLVVSTYANYLTMTAPTGYYELVITGAPVSAATALQGNSHVVGFTVSDTTANVQSGLSSLVTKSKLTSFSLTNAGAGTPTLTLSGSAYAAGAAPLAASTLAYNLVVTGASAAQSAQLQNNSHVVSFAVSDRAANVQSWLSAAGNASKVSTITLTDTSTPTLTLSGAAYAAANAALATITSPYNLNVTGASVAQLIELNGNRHVTGFTIADTQANIQSRLGYLGGDALSAITVTDSATPTFTLSEIDYAFFSVALARLTNPYNVSIPGKGVVSGVQPSFAEPGTFDTSALHFTQDLTPVADAAGNLFSIDIFGGPPMGEGCVYEMVLNADNTYTTKDVFDFTNPFLGWFTQAGLTIDAAGNLWGTAQTAGPMMSMSQYGDNAGTVFELVKTGTSYVGRVIGAFKQEFDATTWSTVPGKYGATPVTNIIADASGNVYGSSSGGPFKIMNSGFVVATSTLSGNTASVSAGLNAPAMSFIGAPAVTTLPTGSPEIINATLSSSMGIQEIDHFQYMIDKLVLNLNGANLSVVHAADTLVNGVAAISVYSGADPTHGILLTGMTGGQTAANLMSSHLTFSNGNAIIN